MSVYTCKLQPIGLQLSDKYVHYYYGYCILLTPETYSRPTDSDVRGITQVSVIHLRNPQFQDGRRSSPWTMQTPCLRPIEISIFTGLIWLNHANMILYHSAFGSLVGIILIGDQCVPGVYLLFLAVILDLASRWLPPPPLPNTQKQKHNFNTRNGFVTLKLVGLWVLL